MTRQQKYPDTSTFHNYNANPKNKIGGDCVIRAISTALGQSWEQTVRELTEVGIKYGYVLNDKHTYSKYLEAKGWRKMPQPKKDNGTKYTGEEFCREVKEYTFNYPDRIIAHIGGHHIVAIIHGKVWDTWNSTDGCIGNYWVKK